MTFEDLAFLGGLFLFGLLFMVLGALMLASPPAFLRFGLWLGKLFRLNPPEVGWKPGLYLDWRLAGLVLASFGASVLKQAVRLALNPPSPGVVRSAYHSVQPTLGWLAPVGGLVMLTLGLYTLIHAPRLFRWMLKKAPIKVLGNASSFAGVIFFRLLGILWALGGIVGLAAWFKALR